MEVQNRFMQQYVVMLNYFDDMRHMLYRAKKLGKMTNCSIP